MQGSLGVNSLGQQSLNKEYKNVADTTFICLISGYYSAQTLNVLIEQCWILSDLRKSQGQLTEHPLLEPPNAPPVTGRANETSWAVCEGGSEAGVGFVWRAGRRRAARLAARHQLVWSGSSQTRCSARPDVTADGDLLAVG